MLNQPLALKTFSRRDGKAADSTKLPKVTTPLAKEVKSIMTKTYS